LAEDQVPRRGLGAFGHDDQVEGTVGAVREGDRGLVLAVRDGRDVVAGDQFALPVEPVDEQPAEFSAQDLHLGGGAVARTAGVELRVDVSPFVDELGALLAGAVLPGGVLEPHPAHDLAGGAADVDVLPARPEPVGSFDDRGVPAVAVEPVSRGRTGDAGSADECVTRLH
jgi:hypothetical protein